MGGHRPLLLRPPRCRDRRRAEAVRARRARDHRREPGLSPHRRAARRAARARHRLAGHGDARGAAAGVDLHPDARGATGLDGGLRRGDRVPHGLHRGRRRAATGATDARQFIWRVPAPPRRAGILACYAAGLADGLHPRRQARVSPPVICAGGHHRRRPDPRAQAPRRRRRLDDRARASGGRSSGSAGRLHRSPGQLQRDGAGGPEGLPSAPAADGRLVRAALRPAAHRAPRRPEAVTHRGNAHARHAGQRQLAAPRDPARRRSRCPQPRCRDRPHHLFDRRAFLRRALRLRRGTASLGLRRRRHLGYDEGIVAMKLVVTGGAGFIGSNFIRHVLASHPADRVVNLDKLTYAGNRANLADLEGDPRYTFVHGDICDGKLVRDTLRGVDAVVNFAAESHVDRSLMEADAFLKTDVFGVFTLLEAVRELRIPRLLHVGTDEVYGSVPTGSSAETDPLRPSNPYSASKAGGDMLALAYWHTHRVPVVITRSSNNFGPYQYPEKVIPLFVTNALDDRSLPLYGDGRNVRDWLYVADNCAGIDLVLRKGSDGEVYNIGGGHEVENVVLTHEILRLTGKPETLIQRVADRPGHDRRYSVDCSKVRRLGWEPRHPFSAALEATVRWYREHEAWWRPLKSGEFRAYYERQYGNR